MIGPADTFIALAIILLAIVSLMITGSRRQAVTEGRARASDLSELSGIFDPRILQDVFGPPTLNGIYQTDMERIKQVRQPLALLISDDRFDIACIIIAIANFFVNHALMDLMLITAAAYQTAGWIVSPRVRKR